MSGRLTAGLALLGALVAGVVIGLLLVAPAGPDDAAVPPAPPPATTAARPTAVTPAPDADIAAVTVLAHAIADAIQRRDAKKFGTLTCRPQTSDALSALQKRWDAAGPMAVTLPEAPTVDGDSAGVNIHVEGTGGRKQTPFPMRRENGRWCVPG
ncbi:MAG TPA: hypothetical protein VGL64_20335 [Amycolatopsis sp.]